MAIATNAGRRPPVMDPAGTAENIEKALESSKLVGINWPEPASDIDTPAAPGPIMVRDIDPSELAATQLATIAGGLQPYDLLTALGGTANSHYFEVTFQGEVHDTVDAARGDARRQRPDGRARRSTKCRRCPSAPTPLPCP